MLHRGGEGWQGLHEALVGPERPTGAGIDLEGQLVRRGRRAPGVGRGHQLVAWDALQAEVEQHGGQEGPQRSRPVKRTYPGHLASKSANWLPMQALVAKPHGW